MNMKLKKIYSILFVLFISLFGCCCYINNIQHQLNKRKLQAENAQNLVNNNRDWKKEFPLDQQQDKKASLNLGGELRNNLKYFIDIIDGCLKIHAPLRMTFVEIGHKLGEMFSSKTLFDGQSVVRFSNGYLGYIIKEKHSYHEEGLRAVNFGQYVESLGIKFCFILCPSKFSKFKDDFPKGLVNSTNNNADTFMDILYKNNIKALDLRENLHKDFPNHFDAFFKTDHHWKPETGLWATQQITKWMNNRLAANLDESVISPDRFNYKVYPKIFLGSQGKKLSLSLTEPEDFTVITPKYETDFEFEVYCRGIKKSGPFETALLDSSNLSRDYYNITTYNTYLGFDDPVVRITNKKTDSKTRILLIKDSYAMVVAPFLALEAKEVYLVDVRKDQIKYFDGSLKKLIKHLKPDIAACLYNVSNFSPVNPTEKDILAFQ